MHSPPTLPRKGDLTLILGKGRFGKTTLAGYLCMLWERHVDRRIVVVDPAHVWGLYPVTDHVTPDGMPYIVEITNDSQAAQVFTDLLTLDNYLLVVDELQKFSSPHSTIPALQEIAQYGRNRGITFIGITRQPFYVSNAFLSNYNLLYVYRMPRPQDRQYLAGITGYNLEFLKDLPEYEYRVFTD